MLSADPRGTAPLGSMTRISANIQKGTIQMCTVSINIDEAAMRQIDPRLTSRESIGRWVQHQMDLLLEEMAHNTAKMKLLANVGSKAENRKQALKRDMTPEQLYSVISDEIDNI